MLPLRDSNPTERTPVVTIGLIAACVTVFLLVQPFSLGASTENDRADQIIFLACRASIPYEVLHGQSLSEAPRGSFDATGDALAQVQDSQCPNKRVWLAVLLSLFLHGGLAHLGFNMLFLWVFGNNIEDRLGRLRFVLFYVAAGIAATIAQALADPNSARPLIGASGAIAGVLGAYLLLFPRAHVRTLIIFGLITVIDLPAVVVLTVWFGLQFLQGFGPAAVDSNVAYLAHVGGFIAGMVLIALMPGARRAASRGS